MTGRRIDLSTWERAPQYALFRSFAQPHFNITARVDVSRVMEAKRHRGLSPFRATLWAVGQAIHALPAFRTRFDAEGPILYDRVAFSTTVDKSDGSLSFTYLDWEADRAAFDRVARSEIEAVAAGAPRAPNTDRLDLVYASCLPWLDYTALDSAMPHADDCIPRLSWGRIVPTATGHDMAMTCTVHHAIADGRHVAEFFTATQEALDSL